MSIRMYVSPSCFIMELGVVPILILFYFFCMVHCSVHPYSTGIYIHLILSCMVGVVLHHGIELQFYYRSSSKLATQAAANLMQSSQDCYGFAGMSGMQPR